LALTKVLICEPNHIVRAGLESILGQEPRIKVVGTAIDLKEGVTKAEALKPHVLIINLSEESVQNAQLFAARIASMLEDVFVLGLVPLNSPKALAQAFYAGIAGFVRQDVTPEQLVKAILAAVHKKKRSHTTKKETGKASSSVAEILTRREMEVLRAIVDGKSNREIAAELFISEKTVKNHITNMLRKLDVQDRTQAAVLALREGEFR
jgi:DNA-binding NarL/FixJ family response regulator